MSGRLAGKVAIVTGAASGIGAASARRFAAEGARVVAADRDGTRGAALVEEIRAAGGEACFVAVDVTRAEQVAGMVAATEERYGRVDVLFANAGILVTGGLHETPDEAFDRVVEVNLKGVFLTLKHGIPALLRAGGGVVLTTASGAGLLPRPRVSAYSATKAAVIALTKAAAQEYGPQVRAVAICPGPIDTPMQQLVVSQADDPAEFRRKYLQDYPLRRYGEADEVAATAVFLASDDAAYITGVALAVDGGRTLH